MATLQVTSNGNPLPPKYANMFATVLLGAYINGRGNRAAATAEMKIESMRNLVNMEGLVNRLESAPDVILEATILDEMPDGRQTGKTRKMTAAAFVSVITSTLAAFEALKQAETIAPVISLTERAGREKSPESWAEAVEAIIPAE